MVIELRSWTKSFRKRREFAARPASVSFLAWACSWGISVSSIDRNPPLLKIVLLQWAAQLLEGTAAHAEDRERFGNGIVVPEVDLGVEIPLVLLGRILLVKPTETLVPDQRKLVTLLTP